jgi:hypothetical protein
MQFQAHRDGVSMKARAQALAPGVDRRRAVFETQTRPARRAGGLPAAIVFGLCPGAATKGGKCCRGMLRPMGSPSVWDRSAKGPACWCCAKALEGAGGAADSEDALRNARAPAEASIGS